MKPPKQPEPTSPTEKASNLRGRPEKDIAHIQSPIPYSADEIAKAILKAPAGSIKNRYKLPHTLPIPIP